MSPNRDCRFSGRLFFIFWRWLTTVCRFLRRAGYLNRISWKLLCSKESKPNIRWINKEAPELPNKCLPDISFRLNGDGNHNMFIDF